MWLLCVQVGLWSNSGSGGVAKIWRGPNVSRSTSSQVAKSATVSLDPWGFPFDGFCVDNG